MSAPDEPSKTACVAAAAADARAIDVVMATLNQLERGIEERFPLAPALVRVGLDCLAA